MSFEKFCLVVLFASAAFPQMPATGSFYYTLAPREAKGGEPVTFQVFEFNMCMYRYDVTYTLLPTQISSKKTMIVNMVAVRRPECALAAGYSGPRVVFENLEAGAYVLQFDSTSEFRVELGDTNRFEIKAPLGVLSKMKPGNKPSGKWKDLGAMRIDGKVIGETAHNRWIGWTTLEPPLPLIQPLP
ncbi:MAG: hypothetical protein JWP91_3092 [Fibrobacteres bacterium]|nr:hypothetical protein [Fibrobacterota bacterium]